MTIEWRLSAAARKKHLKSARKTVIFINHGRFLFCPQPEYARGIRWIVVEEHEPGYHIVHIFHKRRNRYAPFKELFISGQVLHKHRKPRKSERRHEDRRNHNNDRRNHDRRGDAAAEA